MDTSRKSQWKQLASKYWFKTPWLNLREDRVELPNEVILDTFHVMEYPDWACVICLTQQNEIILVEQFRYASEQLSFEFPAGMINPHELALDGAKRELLEETGFASSHWELVGTCRPEPARHTNQAHIFLAQEAFQLEQPRPDASENLTLHFVKPNQIPGLIQSGKIFHGIHIAGYYWAKAQGKLIL